jgi:hypothetical protein
MWDARTSFMRVTLLLLVSSSFAAGWANDQHRQAAFLVARREAWPRTVRPEAVVSAVPPRDRTEDGRTTSASEPSEREADQPSSITLPADVAPGTYRIADASGRLDTMIIHKTGAASSTTRDLYFVMLPELGPCYLIRIHPRTLPVDAHPPLAAAAEAVTPK